MVLVSDTSSSKINKQMAGVQSGAPSYLRDGNCNATDNLPQEFKSGWYFSRKDIENNSPSRKDGIDLRKESKLRMFYCSFLQDLGMRLGVSQVTIATAMIFCHRFYLHQSHGKNDWQTVATVCIFLASKAEDTPISLDKVIIAAYEMIHRRDPATAQKICQKDVFLKQKELILIGERLVLSTIRFDFNIQHPYKPLIQAMNKFGITQKDACQMAWNFVNDWLQTTLCLQYKPHYIAAGTLYMTAKIQKVKLPSVNGYVWWHEFDVTPHQLDVVIQEMTELLGYKRRLVATCVPKKPAQTPLPAKEEASSSPDSCVLSGSTDGILSHDIDGKVGENKPVDSIEASSSCCNPDGRQASVAAQLPEPQCSVRDPENTIGVVDDGEISCNVVNLASAQPYQAAACHGKINMEKIKVLIKRKKCAQKISSSTKAMDDESEDCWIERELEAGIELSAESSKKKQRLS